MDIYRIWFNPRQTEFIGRVHIAEVVRSNFLEDNIVGCIFGYADTSLSIVVVDWKTRGVARINTGVEVSHEWCRGLVLTLY
jgi:hypothetical protein